VKNLSKRHANMVLWFGSTVSYHGI
jgi:hypothetical protein